MWVEDIENWTANNAVNIHQLLAILLTYIKACRFQIGVELHPRWRHRPVTAKDGLEMANLFLDVFINGANVPQADPQMTHRLRRCCKGIISEGKM